MILKRTISNYLPLSKHINKTIKYMSHESKNVFNHYLFCCKIFNEYKQDIYKKLIEHNFNKDSKSLTEKFLIEMSKYYDIYSKYLETIKNNNNIIFKFITNENPDVYNYNFDELFNEYNKKCKNLNGLIKCKKFNNITYENIIRNILKSRYFKNYYQLRLEMVSHVKPKKTYDERFIKHVKDKSPLFGYINNHKELFKSEQNLLRRFAYKMFKDCILPSDIIINIMNKCYSTYSSHLALRQKGIRTGQIKYLSKDGHYIIPFFTHCFKIVNNRIRLSIGKKIAEKMTGNVKNNFIYIKLPRQFIRNNNYKIKLIEISPIYNGYRYKINIIYDKTILEENNEIKNQKDLISIDLGVKNLMTIYDPISEQKIIKGSLLTTSNYYFNKKIDEAKSKLPKGHKTSALIRNLLIKRDNILNYKMNKIINRLYETYKNKKGIVIGYNENWKQKVSIGRLNNRKFYEIPYEKIIKKMENKFVNTKIVKINEAYTSKCDSLNMEEIKKKEVYDGKRIKRGLFSSKTGRLINADLNGAINIMRLYCAKEKTNMCPILGIRLCNPINISREVIN